MLTQMAGGEVKLISYVKLYCINKELIFFYIYWLFVGCLPRRC